MTKSGKPKRLLSLYTVYVTITRTTKGPRGSLQNHYSTEDRVGYVVSWPSNDSEGAAEAARVEANKAYVVPGWKISGIIVHGVNEYKNFIVEMD